MNLYLLPSSLGYFGNGFQSLLMKNNGGEVELKNLLDISSVNSTQDKDR
jgi:hypothetical protein